MIDLHTHTNASDGELSPKDLVDEAIKRGLRAIAITDHDTVGGIQAALDYSADKDIEVVPGIEISCEEKNMGFDEVHVLGLFIDFKNNSLLEMTRRIKECRIGQKRQIIKKLNELGFDITFSEVKDLVKSSFSRVHIASVLLKKYPSKFSTIQDVFDKYLAVGKPGYIGRKDRVDVQSAIDIIKEAGGLTFLAHPGIYKEEDTRELIDFFRDEGGQGIETSYPYDKNIRGITKEESIRKNVFLSKLAKEKNLLEMGGTDFHGSIRKANIGDFGVSMELFKKLKNSRIAS